MKRLLILITIIAALTLPGLSQDGSHVHLGHDHVAQASVYEATCSKGDLHARFNSRAAALAAAQAHQRATGHRTGVRKM